MHPLVLAASVCLHLAPLALLLEAATGAMSDGSGGADLASVRAAAPLFVELVADRAPPPDIGVAEIAPPSLATADQTPVIVPRAILAPPPPAILPPPQMPAPSFGDAPPDLAGQLLPDPAPPPDVATTDAPPAPVQTPPGPTPAPSAAVVDPPAVAEPKPKAEKPEAEKPKAEKPKAEKPKTGPQSAQATAGRKAETAAGQGKGAAAGKDGTSDVATRSKARIDDLKAAWGARIRARIERHKAYPAAARGASGKVTLVLTIGRDGRLLQSGISRSSGNAALDEAALKAVIRAGRFPAAPQELTEARHVFSLSVSFRD